MLCYIPTEKNGYCLALHGYDLEYLNRDSITVEHNNYDNVYVGILKPIAKEKSQMQILDALFTEFNINHPSDFTGASMSVSDVVGLKVDGVISFYYVDRVGFARQRLFNPLG